MNTKSNSPEATLWKSPVQTWSEERSCGPSPIPELTMSTSTTVHPANRRIADSPSLLAAGPENKCRHRGWLHAVGTAGNPGAGSGAPSAAAGGPEAGSAATGASK
eukprot:5245940-Alexandrium_andersonii.AAC.1